MREMLQRRLYLLAFFVLGCMGMLSAGSVAPAASEAADDPGVFSGLQYRLVGPFVGGRVSGVAGVRNDPHTYYLGAVAGGVWKTTDGGLTWAPVFDAQPIASIGAIAVAESDPNVIYVGTGEACFRSDVSHGNGIYKSMDGGQSWEHVGLTETRHIGRVVIHPRDPNVVYVAALGQAHGMTGNRERGVYRSRDGGRSWEQVLYVNEKTGAVDLTLDVRQPDRLYAAMWEVYRLPWALSSGGPGSGVYRSTDGGTTWTPVRGGLPQGLMGKIGVAISPADSRRVYALIEASEAERGMYRSDDGGESWRLVSQDHEIVQRPWYFLHVTADPVDPDVVYVPSLALNKSLDGGRTWRPMKQYHGDNHSLWIDPGNPKRMINGNDGGANVTVNGGETWTRSDTNQPTGQFYHVITDNRFPYYIYGSMQDYITMAIASRSNSGRITEADMYDVGGCEMGYIAPSRKDPNIVFAGCTDGRLTRYDHRTGRELRVDPWPESFIGYGAADAKYRFNWTAPTITSYHDPDVVYHGGNVLFKSTNGGQSWTIVSPDLTRDDKSKQQPSGGPLTRDSIGLEYYNLIFALAESPRLAGVLWAGTDDGLVHVTRDGGGHWANVTPPGLPEWSRVSLIDASPHEAGAAYVAVDRHQLNDFRPYIYKTADYGQTWTLGVTGIPEGSYVRAVREDPRRRGLLYAGTELGVYVSLDDGASWRPLRLNMPVAPVHDLVVQGHDLVVGTHGRGIWVLDDVGPLRQWTAAARTQLFTPSETVRVRMPPGYPRVRPPAGENPPAGAILYYRLGSAAREISLTVRDAAGEVAWQATPQELGTASGLHRVVWDLRYPGPRRVPGAYLFQSSLLGPLALTGRYQVTLTVDGQVQEQLLAIAPDPRVTVSASDLAAQFRLHREIRDSVSAIADVVMQGRALRAQLAPLQASEVGPVRSAAEALVKKLHAIEDALTQRRLSSYADSFHYGIGLDNKLSHLMDVVGGGADGAPPAQTLAVYQDLRRRAEVQLKAFAALLATDVPALNKRARDHKLPALSTARRPLQQLDWGRRQSALSRRP